MVRTQIYLTDEERLGLSSMAQATGRKQSELIREAVDRFIEMASASRRKFVLNRAAGIWRNRDDLPDLRASRRSWDRG